MKTLGLFETKNRLSEVCEQVASTSEPLVVTRHGKPLVQIIPYVSTESPASVWDTVAESRAKHGPLTDHFDLPKRDPEANRPNPLA